MRKTVLHCLVVILLVTAVLYLPKAVAETTPQVKCSVFNFGTVNMEASGYGTTVTNMLMNSLAAEPSLEMLDRKELEQFLNISDLQQNDDMDNVVNIGTRLGLNVIVVGGVEKKGSVIIINCKVIHIEQKRLIFNTKLRALGDAALVTEVRKLSSMITGAISNMASKLREGEDKSALKGPVNVQKRAGNKRVFLSWEETPGMSAAGYEVFRSNRESGPFARVAQTNQPEYLDQELDRNTTYYYKIRAFNNKGIKSEFSSIISAETALTPNPPMILRAEGHVKSIQLTWSPSPMASDDTLKLKGYKLYRAKVEKGPYKEIANVLGTDLGIGSDASTTLDKIFKVSFVDKGLADGEDYYYRLTAYNEKNLESDFSALIKGNPIQVVDGLVAHGDMIRKIILTWNPIESSFIQGYYVYRSTAENTNYTKIKKIDAVMSGGKKLQYEDQEGLGDKVRYYYRVTAFEEADVETSPSMTTSAETKGKPPVPKNLKAQSGLVKMVELSWAKNSEEEVEGYNLYWSKDKIGKYDLLKRISGKETNRYTHGGGENLDDNATYYYTMTSFNKVDVESDLAETAFATTKARPLKPTGLKGETLKIKEVPLRWTENPEKDIAFYHIYRSNSMQGDYSRVTKIPSSLHDYVDKDLKDGVTYHYKLQAEDKDGLISDFSEIVSMQTKPKPQKPTGFTGEYKEGKAELNWKVSVEPDIAHYVIYEKRFFGLEKIDIVKGTSFSDAGISKGKNKSYAVTSVDKDGLESDPSEEVMVTAK